eukprot:EG_transcript_6466
MAQAPLPDSVPLDPKHDPAVHFDLDGPPEETSPQSSHSGTNVAALNFDAFPRQGCEGLAVDDGDFNFNFGGDLRSSVESMLEQLNDAGKVPVSFWRGATGRDFGPISEPVSRSASTINNWGQLLASVPGRDAISQPVSRSVSHLNGLGSIGSSARGIAHPGKETAQASVPLVPKSSSALSGLVPKSNSALSGLGGIWGNVPRSATALGHMWTAASAREPLAPRSVSAINNLGQMWTGTAASGVGHEQGVAPPEPEGIEVDDDEEEEELEDLEDAEERAPPSPQLPIQPPPQQERSAPTPPRGHPPLSPPHGLSPPALGGIPRVAPMEFGAQAAGGTPNGGGSGASPRLDGALGAAGLHAVSVQQLMGQALMLPIVPGRTLQPDGLPGPHHVPNTGSPAVRVAPNAGMGYHPPPVPMPGAESPPRRERRERRKNAKPSQTFQHIQVLSDKVDSRVAEQGYYLAPTTEFRVSKSKARASADAKGTSCLPTYTYDYGTEADTAVWDILRSTMRRGQPGGNP